MKSRIEIKMPIWKNRAFGIADFRLEGDDLIYVTCSYRNKEGELLYPGTYILPKRVCRDYPEIKTGKHTGREIPIADFIKE